MAEQNIRIDYKNPINVEAEVPGSQKIREANDESELEITSHTSKSTISSESVTKDGLTTTIYRTISSTNGEDKLEEKKTKTRIPVSRFRQTVEKVKEERRGSLNKKTETESQIPIRRSSIPKLSKAPTKPARKTLTITKTEVTEQVKRDKEENTTPDDFDKLYEEVVLNTPTPVNIDVSLLNPSVDDPEKLESKFEEIIHDYDHNKKQPIEVEKVKKSKIPFLKRKSQQEIEIRGDRSGQIIAARDKVRLSYGAKSDEQNDLKTDETKTDIKANDKFNDSPTKSKTKVTSQYTKTVTRSFSKDGAVTKKQVEIENAFDESFKVQDTRVVVDKLKENTEVRSQLTKTLIRTSSKDTKSKEPFNLKSNETTKEAKDVNNDKSKENPPVTESAQVASQHTKTVIRTSSKDVAKLEEQINENVNKPDETVKVDTNAINDKTVENAFTTKVEVTNEHNKTVIRTFSEDVSEAVSEDASTKIVGTTTVTEVKTTETSEKIENTKGVITEEILHKEFVKIAIPVFDSHVQEITEKSEIEKTVEVKKILSYNNNEQIETAKETIEIINEPVITEVNIQPTVVEMTDTSENKANKEEKEAVNTENQTGKEKNGGIEDIANLRGKVSRLIHKIDLNETFDKENRKMDLNKELPKNKSVMSRIAMFEHHEEPTKSKTIKNETKIHKLIINKNDAPKVEHIHVHTPLIVDEVFKPFQAKPDSNDATDKDVVTVNGENNIVKGGMVFIESPEVVRYDIENKILIESNTLFIEQNKVEVEELTPVTSKFKPKVDDVESVNENKGIKVDAPVIIPKFKPVREVLKSYESLNSPDDKHVEHKTFKDLARSKSIYEIINDLNPGENPKSLEPMFAHQVEPINEILKDIKPEKIKDKDENIPPKETEEIENEIFTPEETKEYIENEVFTTESKQTLINETKVNKEIYSENDFKSLDSIYLYNKTKANNTYKSKANESNAFKSLEFIQSYYDSKVKDEDMKRAKSLAELDLGDAVKGKVSRMIVRINSIDHLDTDFKEVSINIKEMPRKRSVSEKIALFENKLSYAKEVTPTRIIKQSTPKPPTELTADIEEKISELSNVKLKYGSMEGMPRVELANGVSMPVLAVGTALLDPRLAYHVVSAAISLGYRAIDTAFIYGNERGVGDAIRDKINDGTVTREELFIISKLWSTFHRTELVKGACEASLQAMGLEYFDLYLIHNPMSLKEGGAPIPKIATVLQYSESDYLDAWFGMEGLGSRVKALGVSNFNSVQIQRVLDRARVKPVVNQVECHPYLSQQRLDSFCSDRNITLNCYGVLGSKGTPAEYKSGQPAVIDDALVQVMASGLGVSPAQLLIRYQIESGHTVVVKASSAAHLWDNLQALTLNLTSAQVDALSALNRNKRNFTFKGMGDTHKNYPFNAAF